MDQITHQVRLANWKKIVEQCNCRPEGMSVKQWLKDNGISNKGYYYWLRRIRLEAYTQLAAGPANITPPQDQPAVAFAEIPVPGRTDDNRGNEPFQADAIIRSGAMVIGISNSISDHLLSRLLEAAGHVG